MSDFYVEKMLIVSVSSFFQVSKSGSQTGKGGQALILVTISQPKTVIKLNCKTVLT